MRREAGKADVERAIDLPTIVFVLRAATTTTGQAEDLLRSALNVAFANGVTFGSDQTWDLAMAAFDKATSVPKDQVS